MDRLRSMEVFVAATELGSFAAAAQPMAMTPQMVAKHVQALETRLGVRLLNRTTRRQSLTEFGGRYYERCKAALAEIGAAEAMAGEAQAIPQGLLRITAPKSFGSHGLMGFLAGFLTTHDRIEVAVTLTDRYANLTEEGFEAAFRLGNPGIADSTSLICRPLGRYRLVAVASPDYLARRGTPRHPDDLRDHECVTYAFGNRIPDNRWQFRKGSRVHEAPIRERLRVDDFNAQTTAALNGFGIMLVAEDVVRAHLERGALVKVLTAYEAPFRPLHLIYPADRQQTLKMKVFVSAVVEAFDG